MVFRRLYMSLYSAVQSQGTFLEQSCRQREARYLTNAQRQSQDHQSYETGRLSTSRMKCRFTGTNGRGIIPEVSVKRLEDPYTPNKRTSTHITASLRRFGAREHIAIGFQLLHPWITKVLYPAVSGSKWFARFAKTLGPNPNG